METEAAPEGEPKVLKSLRETGDRQVELLERNFRQDEMVSAQKELAVLLGKPEKSVPRRNPGTGKATRAQAQDVVETLRRLSDKANTPRFLVQSDDLYCTSPRGAECGGRARCGSQARGTGVLTPAGSREDGADNGQLNEEHRSISHPQVIVSPPAPTSFAVAAAT